MKIGIVGNYGKENHGDEAILEGILVQIENELQIERKNILVFSANPIETHQKFGVQCMRIVERGKNAPIKLIKTLIHHKPVIDQLDLLIIGGGGILMDLYKTMPIRYAIYALLTRMTKTPAVVYGTGAGPISTNVGAKLIKYIVDSTQLTMVRDDKSKELLQSIGVNKRVDVITDPAFFIPQPEKQAQKENTFQIGVTSVAYFDKHYWPTSDPKKYENYVNGMAVNLDTILRENPQAAINFFATKHPYDTDVALDIQSRMLEKERCTVEEQEMNHLEILEFINKQDLIIGTRLHSLILSLVTETPIIAVAYHHKVSDFMEENNIGAYTIPIEKIHHSARYLQNLLEELCLDWENTLQQTKTLANKIKNKQPYGMDLIRQLQL